MRMTYLIAFAATVLTLVFGGAAPAQAMCGGNIFMTCPPSASSTKARPPRKVPERRHRRGAQKDKAAAR